MTMNKESVSQSAYAHRRCAGTIEHGMPISPPMWRAVSAAATFHPSAPSMRSGMSLKASKLQRVGGQAV